MTTMVAVYYDGNRHRAVAVDAGTGGSNAEVWKAVEAALPGNDLIAIVEGARGTDAFCMVAGETLGEGNYVTLAPPPAPVSGENHEASAKKTKGA